MNQSMQFEFLAIATGIVALLLLFIAYRLLATSRWVMGWIQGNAGLGLLLLTGLLALAIVDIRSYRPMFDNSPIATISLHTLGPGSHQLRLVDSKGIEQGYTLAGDQYQLVISQFRWATRFSGMGMGHGYRVHHLVAIENDRKTDVPVSAVNYVDVWQFFHRHMPQDFLVSAITIETLPRQFVDGAMYELIPEGFDIAVVPLNQVAKEADALALQNVALPDTGATTEVAAPEAVALPIPEASVTPPVPAPVTKAPVVTAPQPKTETMPGAHIQATPATLIEKPADPKSN